MATKCSTLNEFWQIDSDISDQQSNTATNTTLTLYKKIIGVVSDSVIVTDCQGKIFYVNRKAEEMYGWSKNELINTNIDKRMVTPFSSAESKAIINSLQKDNNWSGNFLVESKTGTTFQTWVTKTPILDEQGKLIGIIDISHKQTEHTDLKRTENELRKQRDFAENIVETAQVIILVLDKDARILRFNRYMEELSGYTFEEVKGKDWFSTFLPQDDQIKIKGIFKKAIDNIQTQGNINPIKVRDGTLKTIMWYDKTLKDQSGHTIGLLAIGHDITEQLWIQKNLNEKEELLRQAEKMQAIGQLAGGIAHDFNNILGGIIGYADMTLDDVPENSISAKNIEQILTACDRAKHLINQILMFSRNHQEEKENIFLYPLVKEVIHLLQTSIQSSIIIEEDLVKDTEAIFADPVKIHEILLNLCTNAVHAMPKGGKLRITLREQSIQNNVSGRIGMLNPGFYSAISITDNGKGMNKETLQRIFEPFFTQKEPDQGVGMGLAVVYGIVKSHNGNIIVESEVGKGSTFTIYFPKLSLPNKAKTYQISNLPRGSERILFVDDEVLLIELAKDILKSLGYKVTCIANSRDALEVFKADPQAFDLIITDQIMPGLTGIELARKMLKIRKNLIIILCTGYSSVIDSSLIKEIGITSLCMKPLSKNELAFKIRSTLDNQKER